MLAQKERTYLGVNIDDIGLETHGRAAFSHLAFPAEIATYIEEALRWKNSKAWFNDRRIPWRRGWLLTGVAGNGKSAFARALAEYLDIPIHIFDLATMDNIEFSGAWGKAIVDSPCIVLFEDLDGVFDGRKNIACGDEGDGLTFDCLLNTISGVDNSDGIILIITTNDLTKIDKAIGCERTDADVGETMSTRPGRIDRVLFFNNPDAECRVRIASRILSDWPDQIEAIVSAGKNDTGAQFQERCSSLAMKLFWQGKSL
jgi:SpoVK/Ycf46/Vps4 family AAA+-type ATPase